MQTMFIILLVVFTSACRLHSRINLSSEQPLDWIVNSPYRALREKGAQQLMRAIILVEKTQNSKLLNDQIATRRLVPLLGPLNPSALFGPLQRATAAGACSLVANQIQSYLFLQDPEAALGFILTTHDFSDIFTGLFGENTEGHTILVYPVQSEGRANYIIVDPTFSQFPRSVERLTMTPLGSSILQSLMAYGAFTLDQEKLNAYGNALSFTGSLKNYPKIEDLPNYENKKMRDLNEQRNKSAYYNIEENKNVTLSLLQGITDREIINRIKAGQSLASILINNSRGNASPGSR